MRARGTFQLGRVFGIRIGVTGSWFIFLFLGIWLLSGYFHDVLGGSRTTAYAVAVAGALGYVASLILHELGHALVARRLGIPIVGIDLWFFGGLSQMSREPATPGEEFKVAAAGPAVTLALVVLCALVGIALASFSRFFDVALTREGFTTTPALALVGWLGFINGFLLLFNIVPAYPLDGGRIAHAVVWWRTGDPHRGMRVTGRAGQAFALLLGVYGLYSVANRSGSGFSLLWLLLAMFLYQAASQAVVQGSFGQRIAGVTVADIMDREPVTVPGATTLLDTQEQFFARYSWPWFAVVDDARHYLGVITQQRLDAEIDAGRPALTAADALDDSGMLIRIGEDQPLEALLRSDGMRRLGAMVAVDSEGVLRGVVTLAQVRRALTPVAR